MMLNWIVGLWVADFLFRRLGFVVVFMFAVIAGRFVVFVYIVLLISVGWYALLLSCTFGLVVLGYLFCWLIVLHDFLWCCWLLFVILVFACF